VVVIYDFIIKAFRPATSLSIVIVRIASLFIFLYQTGANALYRLFWNIGKGR
jgi:hypothetical protein